MKLVEGMGEFWFRRPEPGATRASAVEALHALGFTKAVSIQHLPGNYDRFERAIPLLLSVMRTTREPPVFGECLAALEVKWVGPEVAVALLELLRESDSINWREHIAHTIGRVPHRHVLEGVYEEAARLENRWARLTLLLVLAKARDPRTFALGLRMLRENTDGAWRANTLEALAATRDPRAKEVAAQFVDDPDVRLRDEARRILKLPRKK